MIRILERILIVVICVFFLLPLNGQNITAPKPDGFDSMSKLEQVQTLSKLCWQNREKQTDFAIEYGIQGINIAKNEGFTKDLAKLYNYVGVVYQHYKKDTKTAITYYNVGLEISLQVKDSIEIAYVYNNLGDAFYEIGNVPLAFEYAERSMDIFERLKNARGIAYSYINIGSLNRISERYEIALDYFRNAIELRKTFNDSIGIASANLEVAQTLFLMGRTDEAMQYFKESLQKHIQIKNKNYMAYSMQGMADVYLTQSEFDSAYFYYSQALNLCIERNNPIGEIDSKIGMAKALANKGRISEGEKLLEEALFKAEKEQITRSILNAYKSKGEFYHQAKNFQKASENYQNYIEVYDSLFTALQFETLSEVKDRFRITEQLNTVNKNLKSKKIQQIYAAIIIVLLLAFMVILILRNRTIAKLSQELFQSNQAKDKIFSIISHDLVSPFNVMLGTSELLMESIDEKDLVGAKISGQLIQKTSEEAFNLVSNLLNWSRTQRHSITLNKESFDLAQLAIRVKSMVANQAALKNIKLILESPEEVTIAADKDLIQIVLVNLLNNAIKFTNPNGDIKIRIESTISMVRVGIKDNGVGIATERLKLLFSDQAIESTQGTINEKGTGLGLLLCKEFVELNGGKINVNSKPGEGSEFFFSIPTV